MYSYRKSVYLSTAMRRLRVCLYNSFQIKKKYVKYSYMENFKYTLELFCFGFKFTAFCLWVMAVL